MVSELQFQRNIRLSSETPEREGKQISVSSLNAKWLACSPNFSMTREGNRVVKQDQGTCDLRIFFTSIVFLKWTTKENRNVGIAILFGNMMAN